MTDEHAQELAAAVAEDGFDAHRTGVGVLLAAARRRGVKQVLLDVVADDGEPLVARQRALGRLVAEHGRLGAQEATGEIRSGATSYETLLAG